MLALSRGSVKSTSDTLARCRRTIPIDDPADPRLADYVELDDPAARRRRERDELFVAEGVTAIERLLDSGHRVRSVLVTSQRSRRFGGRASTHLDAPVYVASKAVLAATVGFDLHRGAVAAADRRPLPSVVDVLRTARTHRRARGTERSGEPRRRRPLGPRARHRRARARSDVHRPVLPPDDAGQHGRGAAPPRGPRRVMAGRSPTLAGQRHRDCGRSHRTRPPTTCSNLAVPDRVAVCWAPRVRGCRPPPWPAPIVACASRSDGRRRLAQRRPRRGDRLRRAGGHGALPGGDDGTRTRNPHLAKVVRYQLRHVPGRASIVPPRVSAGDAVRSAGPRVP